jgi:opacity protein-like surface antigen
LLVVVVAVAAMASQATAQKGSFEIVGFAGYTFSEGVDLDPNVTLPDSTEIRHIGPQSGASYGLAFEVFFHRDFTVGFQWSAQQATFAGKQPISGTVEFADQQVHNFHGTIAYYYGWPDELLRPFLYGGLGATYYDTSPVEGQPVDGETRFSGTFGAGLKVNFNRRLAMRITGRWTPTLILTEPGGTWCGAFTCWPQTKTDYSHQFELAAGVALRFGAKERKK